MFAFGAGNGVLLFKSTVPRLLEPGSLPRIVVWRWSAIARTAHAPALSLKHSHATEGSGELTGPAKTERNTAAGQLPSHGAFAKARYVRVAIARSTSPAPQTPPHLHLPPAICTPPLPPCPPFMAVSVFMALTCRSMSFGPPWLRQYLSTVPFAKMTRMISAIQNTPPTMYMVPSHLAEWNALDPDTNPAKNHEVLLLKGGAAAATMQKAWGGWGEWMGGMEWDGHCVCWCQAPMTTHYCRRSWERPLPAGRV